MRALVFGVILLVGGFCFAFIGAAVGDGPAVVVVGCQPVVGEERFELVSVR